MFAYGLRKSIIGMIRTYLRIALRHLTRNRIFSVLNIFGLAMGITAFLYIAYYVRFEQSYESFHTNADNIYRVTLELYKGGQYEGTDCETYGPLGPELKARMPEVKEFVRMFHHGPLEVATADRRLYQERIYYADSTVFDVFTCPIIQGNPRALTAPFQAVLTRSTAEKYFGDSDPIGKTLRMEGGDFEVAGIIADLPPNTHLKFDLLLSHVTITRTWEWYERNAWTANNEYTYLLMAPGTDLDEFNEKLSAYSDEMQSTIGEERFIAEPIKDIHLHSHKSFEPEANGNAEVVYFLMIIGAFIIVIAWVNYINLATARALERAREVGIRKVMGSHRLQLIIQFLAESAIVNFVAGMLAVMLFQTGIPLFREITGQPPAIDPFNDNVMWSLFAGLLAFGTLLSGSYPAFVLSSFQPARVLKGKFKSSSHGRQLRRALVVFQFAATVILLIGVITVFLQLNFLRSQDLGMEIDQTLVLRTPSPDGPGDSLFHIREQSFKAALLQHSGIANVAATGCIPGLSVHEVSTTGITRLGAEKKAGSYNFYFYNIDSEFIPTLGMQVLAGRNFEPGVPNHDQIIVNEETVAKLGFNSAEEAVGEKVTFRTRGDAESSTIIGVVRNFNQRSPKEPHLPMFFYYRARGTYYAVRIKTTDVNETVDVIRETWAAMFPNSLLDYFFLNENYERQYRADVTFGRVMASFSTLAIIIACLGLFGLSSYTTIQRTKEIGIRKVLGASVAEIVRLLSREFVVVIVIASLIALPVAWWAMNQWLSQFAVRIEMNIWLFVLPVICILLISSLTVSYQTVRSALVNPTESLRQE